MVVANVPGQGGGAVYKYGPRSDTKTDTHLETPGPAKTIEVFNYSSCVVLVYFESTTTSNAQWDMLVAPWTARVQPYTGDGLLTTFVVGQSTAAGTYDNIRVQLSDQDATPTQASLPQPVTFPSSMTVTPSGGAMPISSSGSNIPVSGSVGVSGNVPVINGSGTTVTTTGPGGAAGPFSAANGTAYLSNTSTTVAATLSTGVTMPTYLYGAVASVWGADTQSAASYLSDTGHARIQLKGHPSLKVFDLFIMSFAAQGIFSTSTQIFQAYAAHDDVFFPFPMKMSTIFGSDTTFDIVLSLFSFNTSIGGQQAVVLYTS